MLGGHGGWDLASFRQLGDRKRLRLEHLEHAKSVGMSQNLKALGGLSERLEARQMGWDRSRHGWGGSKDRFVGVLGVARHGAAGSLTLQHIGISLTVQQ